MYLPESLDDDAETIGPTMCAMGIHREYARLTPAELERALADPIWAGERIDELADM